MSFEVTKVSMHESARSQAMDGLRFPFGMSVSKPKMAAPYVANTEQVEAAVLNIEWRFASIP